MFLCTALKRAVYDGLLVISQFVASGPKGTSLAHLHPVWPLEYEVPTNLPFSSSLQKACGLEAPGMGRNREVAPRFFLL